MAGSLLLGLLTPYGAGHKAFAEEAFDYSKVPKLLITELVPDTTNVSGSDGYEFIEVYNNSTRTINLKDYKLIYRYTNQTPAKDVQWPTGDVPIPSGQAVALWIINGSNDALTAADFNANFGTSLTLGTDLFRISNDGMANGGQRSLVIQDARGQDLVAAHYETDAQTVANKGIFYRYPDSGSNSLCRTRILSLPSWSLRRTIRAASMRTGS
jgi:hypothetical protein